VIVAIVGSRDCIDLHLINESVARLVERYGVDLRIVTGGARGADTMATAAARALHVLVTEFPADWNRYGESAGFRRNNKIIERADMVLAFFSDGPRSAGTSHTVRLALDKGIQVHVHHEGRWTRD
jgi:predicted Rossmann fold nucleotide-binding protein DprA/Smf involved in DNA uptake